VEKISYFDPFEDMRGGAVLISDKKKVGFLFGVGSLSVKRKRKFINSTRHRENDHRIVGELSKDNEKLKCI